MRDIIIDINRNYIEGVSSLLKKLANSMESDLAESITHPLENESGVCRGMFVDAYYNSCHKLVNKGSFHELDQASQEAFDLLERSDSDLKYLLDMADSFLNIFGASGSGNQRLYCDPSYSDAIYNLCDQICGDCDSFANAMEDAGSDVSDLVEIGSCGERAKLASSDLRSCMEDFFSKLHNYINYCGDLNDEMTSSLVDIIRCTLNSDFDPSMTREDPNRPELHLYTKQQITDIVSQTGEWTVAQTFLVSQAWSDSVNNRDLEMMDTILNGLQNEAEITYDPMTNTGVYTSTMNQEKINNMQAFMDPAIVGEAYYTLNRVKKFSMSSKIDNPDQAFSNGSGTSYNTVVSTSINNEDKLVVSINGVVENAPAEVVEQCQVDPGVSITSFNPVTELSQEAYDFLENEQNFTREEIYDIFDNIYLDSDAKVVMDVLESETREDYANALKTDPSTLSSYGGLALQGYVYHLYENSIIEGPDGTVHNGDSSQLCAFLNGLGDSAPDGHYAGGAGTSGFAGAYANQDSRPAQHVNGYLGLLNNATEAKMNCNGNAIYSAGTGTPSEVVREQNKMSIFSNFITSLQCAENDRITRTYDLGHPFSDNIISGGHSPSLEVSHVNFEFGGNTLHDQKISFVVNGREMGTQVTMPNMSEKIAYVREFNQGLTSDDHTSNTSYTKSVLNSLASKNPWIGVAYGVNEDTSEVEKYKEILMAARSGADGPFFNEASESGTHYGLDDLKKVSGYSSNLYDANSKIEAARNAKSLLYANISDSWFSESSGLASEDGATTDRNYDAIVKKGLLDQQGLSFLCSSDEDKAVGTSKIYHTVSSILATDEVSTFSRSEYASAIHDLYNWDATYIATMSDSEMEEAYNKRVMDIMWRGPENQTEEKVLASLSSEEYGKYSNMMYQAMGNDVHFSSEGSSLTEMVKNYRVVNV